MECIWAGTRTSDANPHYNLIWSGTQTPSISWPAPWLKLGPHNAMLSIKILSLNIIVRCCGHYHSEPWKWVAA